MKRTVVCILTAAVLMALSFPIPVSADMGPKPSVRIFFENMRADLCYGTLLSKSSSTGPMSAWDGDEEHIYNYDLNLEIWRAFAEYNDTDGYYFLQVAWKVSETKEIEWIYHPPDSFKILLYYPGTNTFVISGVYERYAFDTYYTVDMDGVNIGSIDSDGESGHEDQIYVYKSYDYTWELFSLFVRIVITVILELCIALLFGYRTKKQFALIAGVNAGTQITLNILLNVINYNSGPIWFTVCYILLELLVFMLEAILFYELLGKLTDKNQPNGRAVLYALVSNAVSFGAGLVISNLIPGIF